VERVWGLGFGVECWGLRATEIAEIGGVVLPVERHACFGFRVSGFGFRVVGSRVEERV
jgi:hypothetical protein